MNRLLKVICGLILSATLALDFVPLESPVRAAGAAEIQRPVIVVAEPSFSDGTADYGDLRVAVSAAGVNPSGALARYLASVGYTPGENLFEVGISGLRDLPDGAMRLALSVRSAVGPAPSCDIVASGLSGLIARYALENGYLDGVEVVNLIMVSAPNRGTFLADVVKSALEMARQESLLEKETRAQRFLPSWRELVGVADDAGAGSIKVLTQASALAPPDWEDEASWISTRSAALWEPLYAEYVKARHFAIPYVPSESPKETYAGWVRRTLPDVWRRLITEAGWPKSAQRELSLPYYEYLAMEVARNQYAMRTASRGSLVQSLFADKYVPTGWKEALIHYGLKILQHYAEKALVTLKAEAQAFVAERAVSFTGLGDGPDSSFISGLIKEDLLINLGTSSSKRFERIPANLGLQGINRSSQASARARHTRYVSVCSRLANPWGMIWPQLGPNDCFLEVDSSVPPVGPGDLVAVFGGVARLPGKSVLDDRKAQSYIADVLSDSLAPTSVSPGIGRASLGSLLAIDVSSWEPRRCPLGTSTQVTVGVTSLPDGWQCQVWEESSDSEGRTTSRQGLMWAFDRGGNYVIRVSPGTSHVGFRLFRTGPANPVAGNSVSSAYAAEVLVKVFVAIAEDKPPDPLDPSGAPGQSDGSPGGKDGDPGGAGGTTGDDPSGDAGGYLPDDLPTVRVVYRSKHTTLKKPKETVHGYWLLDFGDGDTDRIEGSPSLAVDHTYSLPGEYEVTAESYGDDGKLLYSKAWDVLVALAGETRRLTCQSLAPLTVDVVLNGPEKWMTGKTAVFSAGAAIELPPNAELVSVKYDPGETFGVIWERAGDFVVGCAASIIVKYLLEDATIQVENIYLREVPITVLTTGVTQ